MCALNRVRKGAHRAARKRIASKRALCRLGFCDAGIADEKSAPPASEFESACASRARRLCSLFFISSRL
jgi:hypothetical protein